MLSAHGTERCLLLEKVRAALAHAEMTARHEQGVFGFEKAHFASSFFIVIIISDVSLSFLCTCFVLHSVDGFYFERH